MRVSLSRAPRLGAMFVLAALTAASSAVLADEVPFGDPLVIAGAGLDLFNAGKAVDVNGDGAVDAMYSFRDRNTLQYGIAWNESETPGANGPDPLTRWIVTDQSSDSWDALATADFDADGDRDVAAAADDGITLFSNETGLGRTGDWQDFTVTTAMPDAPGVIASADIDRDGDTDIFGYVEAGLFDSEFGWVENLGRDDSGPVTVWTFAEHSITADEVSIARPHDLDGDGDVDIVARIEVEISPGITEFKVVWYENRVADLLPWTSHDIVADDVTAEDVRAIAVKNLDGDNYHDVMFARDLNEDLVWHRNQNGGTSWSAARLIADNQSGINEFKYALTGGDVDQDGDHDVVLAASGSFSSHRVVWFDNENGLGTAWQAYPLTQDGYGSNSVVVRDLDEDGDTDILLSYTGDESNSPRVVWFGDPTIHRGAAYHERLEITAVSSGAQSAVAADMDGDGDQDIVGHGYLEQEVKWYANDGTPGGSGDWSVNFIAFAPRYPQALHAADVDGDGDSDVMVVTSDPNFIGGPGDLVWYENDDSAGGSWSTHTVDDALYFPSSVRSADIDNDGDTDIVSATGHPLVMTPGQVLWFENLTGDGSTWIRHFVASVTNSRPNVSVGDVDGDGDTDIVAATFNDGTVRWFENRGIGWTLHPVTTEADGVRSTHVADLDGDGDADILSASSNDDTVAWYENMNGDGSFGARQVIDASVAGAAVVLAADLDNDADQDVLAGSPGNDAITWYENTGVGAFAAAQPVAGAADDPRGLFVADLDRDGLPDVVSASNDDDTIAWYPNVGGQLALPTDDTAPATLASGRKDDFLRITARHNGIESDPDLDVDALHLRFQNASGATLTAQQFGALVSSVQIYADVDESGTWNAPPDLPYSTVGPIFLPTAPADGYVTFVGGLHLEAGDAPTLFLVLRLDSDAHQQTPSALRAVHVTASTSSGSYSDHDLAVTVEAAPNVASGVVTAIAPDADGDGIPDEEDNCTLAANPPQRDTDSDGIGNMCDPDIAAPNDCLVNFQDLGFMRLAYFSVPFTSNWNPDADLNGDDVVNVLDLAIMKQGFFEPPGPSGVPNMCD